MFSSDGWCEGPAVVLHFTTGNGIRYMHVQLFHNLQMTKRDMKSQLDFFFLWRRNAGNHKASKSIIQHFFRPEPEEECPHCIREEVWRATASDECERPEATDPCESVSQSHCNKQWFSAVRGLKPNNMEHTTVKNVKFIYYIFKAIWKSVKGFGQYGALQISYIFTLKATLRHSELRWFCK